MAYLGTGLLKKRLCGLDSPLTFSIETLDVSTAFVGFVVHVCIHGIVYMVVKNGVVPNHC